MKDAFKAMFSCGTSSWVFCPNAAGPFGRYAAGVTGRGWADGGNYPAVVSRLPVLNAGILRV